MIFKKSFKMEEISIIDSFEIIRFQICETDLSILKKRHMYFMWKNYYIDKYTQFSDYYIEYHRFLLDFDDVDYFILQNIEKTYNALISKRNISMINEYITIITGRSDDLITVYLDGCDRVKRCSCFGFVLYRSTK